MAKETLQEIKDRLANKYYHNDYRDICWIKQERIDTLAKIELNKQN